MMGPFAMMAAGGLMGGISGAMGKPDELDINKIRDYMGPTQGIVDEQLGLSRQMMDPQSAINMQMRNMMAQRASQSGQEVGSQMQKMGAMRNMSSGQAMMQGRMGMNQASGGVNNQWLQALMERFSQGTGIMGRMGQQQQGLDENLANAYITNQNIGNQYRTNLSQSIQGGLMGGLELAMKPGSGSDIALKENIELVGKSPKGVNIYEFDYKDKSYGKGRYRGVMAQEVPNASFKQYDGYLWVNYNKVDVDFERIN